VKSSALNTQPISEGMDADHTALLYHMKVRWLQARNEEGKGAQFPGRRVTMGAPNHCEGRRKVPTMSQVLSSIQYMCFRKTSVSNMGAPDLLLAPGAI